MYFDQNNFSKLRVFITVRLPLVCSSTVRGLFLKSGRKMLHEYHGMEVRCIHTLFESEVPFERFLSVGRLAESSWAEMTEESRLKLDQRMGCLRPRLSRLHSGRGTLAGAVPWYYDVSVIMVFFCWLPNILCCIIP